MDLTLLIILALLMGLGAALYSAVGHGGASAYLALMALAGLSVEVMRPVALSLNLIVAGYATWRYVRADQFDLRLFGIFAVSAIPFAFIGGSIVIPPEYYRPLVGIVLAIAAIQLMRGTSAIASREPHTPSAWLAMPIGAMLGLLAGLTGTGGGIFLSPLILLLGWASPRVTSGVAAAFILCNSIAGLAGNLTSLGRIPPEMPWFMGAVAIGALIGTRAGVNRLSRKGLLRVLAVVLLLASGKLLFA